MNLQRWALLSLLLANYAYGANVTHRTERIKSAFNDVNANTLSILDSFYDAQIVFQDPLGKIEGLPAVRAYYEKLYQGVQSIRFDFSDTVAQGDSYAVYWDMHLVAKGLNGGKEVVLGGSSLLKFNAADKVVYHRDYFDMGEFIYEHIPLLRSVIGVVKRKLAH